MFYGYYFWGMHAMWWFIWFIFLFWIFVLPYDIPGERRNKKSESPLDILKRRFASGQITKAEYEESKKVLESDSVKNNSM
ncbi:SHOCT domain-containing protein [Chitinophaga oryziterrae]|uniref:SHOCT domain-containing protein n=2 Tax=Chitinophaga oryziterrae TaxID=1031224 RepID=A0A6N8J5F7_9BACT|nr:SHOCT domain-containing protein [Chitinophaga oryziterrae]